MNKSHRNFNYREELQIVKSRKNTTKDESATKKRRKILRVGRLQQNVNYNTDYKNPKDVRKHKSKIITNKNTTKKYGTPKFNNKF